MSSVRSWMVILEGISRPSRPMADINLAEDDIRLRSFDLCSNLPRRRSESKQAATLQAMLFKRPVHSKVVTRLFSNQIVQICHVV